MINKPCLSLIALFFFFSMRSYTQDVQVLNFEEFEPRLHLSSDSVYFINFWATWCVPCIKEIPAIKQLAEKYKDEPLKILLVSLDMPSRIEKKLNPFILKNKIEQEVIVLDDPDFNHWINKVSPSWSGSIPASLIYAKNSRSFYERGFEFTELDSIINLYIK